jgi:hypothetical protein
MRLAKGRIEPYSAFRQPHFAFADFCEIRPYFVCGNGAREMGLAKGEMELYSTFCQPHSGLFFHFGNKALFLPFVSLISIMSELHFW